MNNLNYEGWLASNLSELESYREMSDKRFTKGIHFLFKSHEAIERWDHVAYKSEFGALLKASTAKSALLGLSPLHELAKIYDEKMWSMANMIIKGYKLLINDVGGYCYITHDDYEVITEYTKKKYYKINDCTKWINLENDPHLEKYTQDILGSVDRNYSFILNTHDLLKSEIEEILTEFKNKGGTGIWQYTTAMDIEQLYMFIDTGIEVGLVNFEINFNAGSNMDIRELIAHYENNENINFKYNFVR